MDTFEYSINVLVICFVIFLLFILPYIPLFLKIFKGNSFFKKIYMALATEISLTTIIVIILAYFGLYTIFSFILVYLLLLILIYIISFRIFSINTLKKVIADFFSFFQNLFPQPKQENGTGLAQRLKNRIGEFIVNNLFVIILLVLALIIGIYVRMSYSFSHLALPSIDPYGHLFVTKILTQGTLYQSLGVYDDYPRGFHAIVSVIHFYSGLDVYTTMRFLGGVLGVISIGAMYCLISALKDKVAGAFAAFIYSGIIITKEIEVLTTRQIQPIPEVMGYVLVPIILLFAYELFRKAPKLDKKFIFLLCLSSIALFLIHPYTALMCFYLIFLLTIIFSIANKKIIPIAILVILGIIPIIITFTPIAEDILRYTGDLQFIFQDLFTIKTFLSPSPIIWFIITLAILCVFYGLVINKTEFVFIGSCCVLFSFMNYTGVLTISRLPVSRVAPFFAITIIWVISFEISEILEKANDFGLWLKNRFSYQLNLKKKLKYIPSTKSIVLVVIIILMLSLIPPKPPELPPFEYEDAIETTLKIKEEFPMESTVLYSDKIFLVNIERTIIEPAGKHYELEELLVHSPQNFTPEKRFTFILVENYTFFLRVFSGGNITNINNLSNEVKDWIELYKETHDNISVYYSSRNIDVYLIEVRGER